MIKLGIILSLISFNAAAAFVSQKDASVIALAAPEGLQPYQGAPPVIQLTPAQKEQLAQGKAVYPPLVDNKDGGSAIAVFKVNAPAEFIWKVISQFDQYPNWVDGVKKTIHYKPAEGDSVYIQFTVGKWFTPSYTYHIIHNFPKLKTGWGTWSLDTSQSNDLVNCRGFWRVTPAISNLNQSIVEYSVDLKGKGMMMEIARPTLLKDGVENATSWVSKQAEVVFAEHVKQTPKPLAENTIGTNN